MQQFLLESIEPRGLNPSHSGFGRRNFLEHPMNTLTAFARSISGAVARRAAYKRTLTELRRLSDRELADIGINRYDINHVAARVLHG